MNLAERASLLPIKSVRAVRMGLESFLHELPRWPCATGCRRLAGSSTNVIDVGIVWDDHVHRSLEAAPAALAVDAEVLKSSVYFLFPIRLVGYG